MDVPMVSLATRAAVIPGRNRLQVVDGLRAFAIVPVVMFHAWPHLFGGGFIGVDIFFVLSGFVISLRYLDDLTERRSTFRQFYLNRIRRLAPAYITLVVVVTVAAAGLLYPKDLVNFGESLAAQAVSAQNIVFWNQGQYFDGALLKPLLHTWSLAVEEQFYLLFPLLVLVMRRGRRLGVAVLIGAVVLSAAAGLLTATSSPKTAFYLLPSRIWQFCAGILAALAWARVSWPAAVSNAVGIVAVVALVASMAGFDRTATFPGPQALLAVGGTAALCLVQSGLGPSLRWVFANRLAQHLGRVSYSWYLWHWPPIVFFAICAGHEPTFGEGCCLILAGYLLGLASYVLVERRTLASVAWRSPVRLWTTAAILPVFAVICGAVTIASNGLTVRYPPAARSLFEAQVDRVSYRCGYVRRLMWWQEQVCRLNDLDGPGGILLLGDSHADGMKAVLVERATAAGLPVYLTKQNCKLADFGVVSNCGMAVWAGITRDVAAHRITTIVAIQFWAEPPTPAFVARFKGAVERVLAAEVELDLERPTPFDTGLDPQTRILRLGTNEVTTAYDARAYAAQRASTDLLLDEVAHMSNAVHVLDPGPLLCGPASCAADVDGHPIYLDSHHLNSRGAALLAPMYERALAQVHRP